MYLRFPAGVASAPDKFSQTFSSLIVQLAIRAIATYYQLSISHSINNKVSYKIHKQMYTYHLLIYLHEHAQPV